MHNLWSFSFQTQYPTFRCQSWLEMPTCFWFKDWWKCDSCEFLETNFISFWKLAKSRERPGTIPIQFKLILKNFQMLPAVLCYILIDRQMLEKVFCSNIAPSLSFGNHLFCKAEYMVQSCFNQVWAITFGWSAQATWNKYSWTAFWKPFSGIPRLTTFHVT